MSTETPTIATTETLSERIERVKRKVCDKCIDLEQRLSEDEIVAFETRHRIRLPDAYRLFLLEVGDGCWQGPPSFGLVRLSGTLDIGDERELHLHEPFPLTDNWIWEEELVWSKPFDEVEDWDDLADPNMAARIKASLTSGFLWLGTDGCGMQWILIVTGAERGNVWNTCGEGAVTEQPHEDFIAWFERWMDTPKKPRLPRLYDWAAPYARAIGVDTVYGWSRILDDDPDTGAWIECEPYVGQIRWWVSGRCELEIADDSASLVVYSRTVDFTSRAAFEPILAEYFATFAELMSHPRIRHE